MILLIYYFKNIIFNLIAFSLKNFKIKKNIKKRKKNLKLILII